MDLEKFFDEINHDILMSRVARHVHDRRVLKLIRRYLEAGSMREGIANRSDAATRCVAMRTIATFMCAVRRQANACWAA